MLPEPGAVPLGRSSPPFRPVRLPSGHPPDTMGPMDDEKGATGSAAGKTPAGKAPAGKAPARKAPARKAPARKAPARKATATATATTSAASASGPDRPDGEWGHAGPGPGGRPRGRALYNRRLQRDHERWPLVARVVTGLFARPELGLSLLGARGPVEVEGRVLNPSTQLLLELSRRLPGGSPDPEGAGPGFDPVATRSQFTRMSRLGMPVRTDVHVTGRVIPGPTASTDLPVRIYRQFGTGLVGEPGGSRPPALMFFHGGGWVSGDLNSHDALCRLLAVTSRCIVVSVGYRLAPEDPFPAAVEDALAAYTWVQRHPDEVGHAGGRVGVSGDSAGGNLAAVVALETRPGRGGPDVPPPVAQGLFYPVLDSRLDSPSLRSMGEGYFLTRQSMEVFRSLYLPDRSQWETGRASPLLADDHAGVAPALVVTAGFDPLRDDGARYAEALVRAGVPVEYRCYDDQVHGFLGMGVLPDSLALTTEVGDALGRLMRRSAPDGPGA